MATIDPDLREHLGADAVPQSIERNPWYGGSVPSQARQEIFWSRRKPTKQTHGRRYGYVTGPFSKRADAWRMRGTFGSPAEPVTVVSRRASTSSNPLLMAVRNPLTLDEKRRLVDAPVTLEGRPAKIAGTHLGYAQVATLDGRARGEWSWDAARRIVERGGSFRMNPPTRVTEENIEEYGGRGFETPHGWATPVYYGPGNFYVRLEVPGKRPVQWGSLTKRKAVEILNKLIAGRALKGNPEATMHQNPLLMSVSNPPFMSKFLEESWTRDLDAAFETGSMEGYTRAKNILDMLHPYKGRVADQLRARARNVMSHISQRSSRPAPWSDVVSNPVCCNPDTGACENPRHANPYYIAHSEAVPADTDIIPSLRRRRGTFQKFERAQGSRYSGVVGPFRTGADAVNSWEWAAPMARGDALPSRVPLAREDERLDIAANPDPVTVTFTDPTGTKVVRARVGPDVTVRGILPAIITRMALPTMSPDGQPMSYSLDHKEGGVRLMEQQTLREAGVMEGHHLVVFPEIVAGNPKRRPPDVSTGETPNSMLEEVMSAAGKEWTGRGVDALVENEYLTQEELDHLLMLMAGRSREDIIGAWWALVEAGDKPYADTIYRLAHPRPDLALNPRNPYSVVGRRSLGHVDVYQTYGDRDYSVADTHARALRRRGMLSGVAHLTNPVCCNPETGACDNPRHANPYYIAHSEEVPADIDVVHSRYRTRDTFQRFERAPGGRYTDVVGPFRTAAAAWDVESPRIYPNPALAAAPFHTGKKIPVKEFEPWLAKNGTDAEKHEYSKSKAAYKKFHRAEPQSITRQVMNVGVNRAVTDRGFGFSMGDSTHETYYAPKNSKKAGTVYVHKWETRPEAIVTSDGRAIMKPLKGTARVDDWLRG